MSQCIAHGFRQVSPARHARQMVLQPEVQVLDQRSTSQLTDGLAYIRWLTADVVLNFVELGDACQHFSGER
jgi:hypothetical protein